MRCSPEALQEWLNSPCSSDLIELLTQSRQNHSLDLVKVTKYEEFLVEKGIIMGIAEVITYILDLKKKAK